MRQILFYILLPICIFSILRSPFLGILVYTGFNIIRPEMIFWGGAQGSIVFKAVFGATLFSFFINKQLKPVIVFELWLIIWISIAVLASYVLSEYPANPYALEYIVEFFKLIAFGWLVIALLDSAERIIVYEKTILILFSLLAVWGIEQHFRGNTRLEDFPLGDSNGVAALLVFMLPLAMNMAFQSSEKRNKLIGLICTGAIFIAIISTQSRGGFLGASICISYFFVLSRAKKRMISVFIVLILISSPFITDSYMKRMSTITAEKDELDYSAASRLVLWEAGLMIFMDNPFFGSGFMTFPMAKMKYQDRVSADEGLKEYTFDKDKVAHSTYVQVFSEGGLFLAIPYFLLIVSSVLTNYKIRKKSDDGDQELIDLLNAIESGLMGFCACIVFINVLTSIYIPLQVLVMRKIRDEISK